MREVGPGRSLEVEAELGELYLLRSAARVREEPSGIVFHPIAGRAWILLVSGGWVRERFPPLFNHAVLFPRLFEERIVESRKEELQHAPVGPRERLRPVDVIRPGAAEFPPQLIELRLERH